ncbi:MAG: CHRD domain-containing protein [Dehalococcoidia bacterium]
MKIRLLLSLAATLVAFLIVALVTWTEPNVKVDAADFEITFTNFQYSPANVTVAPGDSVVWKGAFSSHPLVSQDGLWPSHSSGSVFTQTFPTTGEFFFYCQIHGSPNGVGMAGKITVQGAGASPTPTGSPNSTPTSTPTTPASPTVTPTVPAGPVGANVSRRLMAVLSSSNEVPTNTSAAIGYARIEVSDDLTQVSYYLSSTITNTTVAHIHLGKFGENGPPIITLASTGGFTEVHGLAAITPEIAAALFFRGLYVNVHSATYPGGEIRGQLVGMFEFGTRMTGALEAPPNAQSSTGNFRMWLWPDLSRLDYVMTHTVAGATAAHIHRALPGVKGPVVVPLDSGSSVSGTATITPGGLYDLLAGNWYVNVHSPGFPDGEVRGQLGLNHQFQAVLQESNEVPPNGSANTGSASFVFDRQNLRLHYVLSTTVTNTVAAHIHVGGFGANGPVSYSLASTAGFTAVRGAISLDPALVALLETGGLYVNVHSAVLPGGEIRGQIYGPELFTARMTPQQETSPVDNQYLGRAYVLVNDGRNGLIYAITHDVVSPIAAHIHRGPPGTPGPVVYPLSFANQASGWSGLSAADLRDLDYGNLYVNIHNGAFPAGAIRGQLTSGTRQLLGTVFRNSRP